MSMEKDFAFLAGEPNAIVNECVSLLKKAYDLSKQLDDKGKDKIHKFLDKLIEKEEEDKEKEKV